MRGGVIHLVFLLLEKAPPQPQAVRKIIPHHHSICQEKNCTNFQKILCPDLCILTNKFLLTFCPDGVIIASERGRKTPQTRKGKTMMTADYWEIMGDAMEEVAEWLDYEDDLAEGNPWAE